MARSVEAMGGGDFALDGRRFFVGHVVNLELMRASRKAEGQRSWSLGQFVTFGIRNILTLQASRRRHGLPLSLAAMNCFTALLLAACGTSLLVGCSGDPE